MFVVDERRMFRPAGLSDFARSNDGHFNDDLSDEQAISPRYLERLGAELLVVEQRVALQNLGLACQAMDYRDSRTIRCTTRPSSKNSDSV